MAKPTGSQSLSTSLDVRPALVHANHQKFVYEEFLDVPFARSSSTPFGNPTGTAGDVNTLLTRDNMFQYHVLGTQDILGPKRVADGLDISQDLTNNDGVEYTLGCEDPANTIICATANRSRGTFKVGTDRPFYIALRYKLTDVSGTDDCAVGFRKAEIYQAAIDGYADMAVLNTISGDIKIETILNDASTTTTDTTQNWADAETHTLMVLVDSTGELYGTARGVYYEIDGVKPTTVPSTLFRFDDTDLVIPFFYFLHDTDVAESTILVRWESGYFGLGETTQPASQS